MVEAEKIISTPRIASHISSATLPSRPTYSIDRAPLPVIDHAALVARYILLVRNQIITDQTFNIVELSILRWIKCYIWPVFFLVGDWQARRGWAKGFWKGFIASILDDSTLPCTRTGARRS
jgi:hypothetical protein